MTRLKIKWSKHIENKVDKELVMLGISRELLQSIVTKPDEVLLDSENGRKVAVNLKQEVAVIYEGTTVDIFIITAIYGSNLDKVVKRRKRSGRWL